LIQDGKIKAWVDVYVKDFDVITEWNRYFLYLTDENDIALKKWQDNIDNFEDATSLAVQHLQELGIIYQDENAKWYAK
jgi:hypothetical protein